MFNARTFNGVLVSVVDECEIREEHPKERYARPGALPVLNHTRAELQTSAPTTAVGTIKQSIVTQRWRRIENAINRTFTFFLESIFIDQATLNGTRPDSP
jgi:hypothetical protein